MKKKLLFFTAVTLYLILIAGCGLRHPASVSADNSSVPTVSVSDESEQTEPVPEHEVKIYKVTPCEIPEGEWQRAVSFPDWNGYTDTTLALNSIIDFKAYHGQGKVFLLPD